MSVSHEQLAVVEEFPARFVVGADGFSAEAGARGAAPGVMTTFHGSEIATVPKKLPPDLAAQIAAENVVALHGAP